ncbi:MAG: hypothetical protein JWN04_4892 [Myxococcaceae bacterium]|nr:hypothetical protein [Myxococcaceae bacterium]
MKWSDIERGDPLEMAALLSFLERNAPGCTRRMRGASEDRIAALASCLHGGASALPRVYLEFLRTMGERKGPLKFTWCHTEVSVLLAARKRPQRWAVPERLFLYATGMTLEGERQEEDQFLDLAQPRAYGADARVVRGTRRAVATGGAVREMFESFSDQLRVSAVGAVKRYFGHDELVGFQPERVPDMFVALRNMGFELTELGGCPRHVPMTAPGKAMVALVTTSGTWSGDPHVTIAARDDKQMLRVVEILNDLENRWRLAR